MMAYLEADLEVITELRAAAEFIAETLVDEAVVLIRAITTVVVTVTQQSLVQTLPITAHKSRLITGPL